MILVIFTGSRYADWRLAEKGKLLHGFRTAGINSYIQDENFINQLLNKNTDLLYNAEKTRTILSCLSLEDAPAPKKNIFRIFSALYSKSVFLFNN